MRRAAVLCALLLSVSGCFIAVIDSGEEPSSQTISKPWAASWIYGLVPPTPIETGSTCPNGIAKVVTQRTFLNSVVGAITFGLYTPMQIVVTCAAGSSVGSADPTADIEVAADATTEEYQAAFTAAADLAVKLDRPIYVRTAE